MAAYTISALPASFVVTASAATVTRGKGIAALAMAIGVNGISTFGQMITPRYGIQLIWQDGSGTYKVVIP